eukprot:tig00020509_g9758.t1
MNAAKVESLVIRATDLFEDDEPKLVAAGAKRPLDAHERIFSSKPLEECSPKEHREILRVCADGAREVVNLDCRARIDAKRARAVDAIDRAFKCARIERYAGTTSDNFCKKISNYQGAWTDAKSFPRLEREMWDGYVNEGSRYRGPRANSGGYAKAELAFRLYREAVLCQELEWRKPIYEELVAELDAALAAAPAPAPASARDQ